MNLLNKTSSLLFIIILSGISLFAQEKKIPDDFCINQKEYQLVELINQYRAKLMLDPITLSKSLSFVARTHAADLSKYYQAEDDCNMHSWSDRGDWKAFCFPADQNRKNDVKDKAKELTNYSGKAWEITYWDNTELDLNNVLDFWKGIEYTSSMLTNTGKWSDKVWKSIGVGIQDGYVLVWLGQNEDIEASTVICETGERILNKSIPNELVIPQANATNNAKTQYEFYIIIASFNNLSDADGAVKGYHQMGYPNAVIVEDQGRVRVAIDKLDTEGKAKAALADYRSKFQGAWIFSK